MVDNKDGKGNSASNQNLSAKKVKATTGAWWKSTVTEEGKNQEIAAPKAPEKETPKAQRQEVQKEKTEQVKSWRPRKRSGNSKRSYSTQKRGRKPSSPRKSNSVVPVVADSPGVSSPKAQSVVSTPKTNTKEDKVVFTEVLPRRSVIRLRKRRPLTRAWKKTRVVNSPLQAILGIPIIYTGLSSVEDSTATKSKEPKKREDRNNRGPRGRKTTRPRRGRKGGRSADTAQEEPVPQINKSLPVEVKEEKKNEGPLPVFKLLINAEEPEECRLALLADGRLESLNVSTVTRAHTKNNIYKAKIVAIEPNLQAAFVDYGTDKNGFLPFSEIHPEYYRQDVSEKVKHLIDTHQWKKLSISGVVEKGQEVLVQVVKEEVGKKGANMTTYLSLPGRCVVLMPGSDSTGISRKIVGEERRRQLRDAMKGMDIPEGIGWIVRTASIDITENALSRDVTYLSRLWEEVKKKGQTLQGVGIVYQDQNSVLRFLREHFDPAIQEILVDDKTAMEQVRNFISLLPTNQQTVKVKLHRGARPIFNQFSVEDQIESIYQPHVNLPSGGSIVIDPTEALVAIDVNSGSTSKGQNFEASIFQANMEAATELARQLRLRDLGGLIVVDFIDMRSKKNVRDVEKQVKNAMRHDKAKVDMSRISKFGLMQISRQKLGAPIEAGNYRVCEHCKGRGTVRSVETLALFYLRRIQTGASRKVVRQVECRFPLDVAQYLLNNKRQELRDLEFKYGADVVIIADPNLKPADHELLFHKGGGEAQA